MAGVLMDFALGIGVAASGEGLVGVLHALRVARRETEPPIERE